MTLEIHENNNARYRWTLVTDDGRQLASSTEAFASYDAALRAAEDMRAQATAVPMEVS